MEDKIDFVIPWVDGNDKNWQIEKSRYDANAGDKSDNRYREWGTLKYWFRGVEKYAPWVNKIHFVTWGHIPEWLDTNNPKINIVKHSDYIPEKYLPTFSTHAIELNMHRIKGLTEHFVYFNDDMYIINHVSKSDFFVKEKPCDIAALYPIYVNGTNNMFDHILLNDAEFFARNFDVKSIMKRDASKWFNLKYGKNLLKTLCMILFDNSTSILLTHQPASYLKSTLQEVWNAEPDLLDKICKNKFRTADDINQYVFRYWQIGKGCFYPYNVINRGAYVAVGKTPVNYDRVLLREKKKLLCLNDTDLEVSFDKESKRMCEAFQRKFPQKSTYEL